MNPTGSLLLVEDDEADVLLLRRAFKEAELQNPLHVARDGQEAIDFLARPWLPPADRLPALVLLDLKMPRRTGPEVLAWMRERPVFCTVPVIVFSSSANRNDIEQAYSLGANAFMVKPPSLGERLELARFIKQWLRFNQPPLACTEGYQVAQTAHATRDFKRPGSALL
jgi:CheY-like chemotaxis protein